MKATLTEAEMLRGLSPEFLQRHSRPCPRYTSYPTAPEWTEEIGESAHRRRMRERCAEAPDAPLSLYVHIPFCEHRCRFCACNVIATRHREVTEPYLHALDQEMAIVAQDIAAAGATRPVSQLHFGGGTPTYLQPAEIDWLMDRIRSHFTIAADAEISIELDPCVTTEAHMHTLRAQGFNRASLGVQDFHRPTQEIIERLQTVEETAGLADLARALGFQSVNFDLVYGLPLQTPESFARTIDTVLGIHPDRIALYNFAFLPGRLGHQRRLDAATLPTGPQKFEIFVSTFEKFTGAGYEHIGMDHFALPSDELARARRDRTIQRNFMGYTTQAGTDLSAFGVSAISASDTVYVQNVKKLPRHAEAVAAGRLPIERGFVLSAEDRLRRAVIYELMCHGHLDKASVEHDHGVQFDEHFAEEIAALAPLADDGLVEVGDDSIDVTLLGSIFVRNVATVFDTYLKAPRAKPTYSKSL